MRFRLFVMALLAPPLAVAQTRWQPSAGHTQVPLWPGTPPDAQKLKEPESAGRAKDSLVAGRGWTYVSNVSQPTLTVYSPPAANNTGVAVLVFPGGGYKILAIDLEGIEVCDWLTAKGITCVVVKYRVPDSGMHYYEDCRCQRNPVAPMALEDAQRALSMVRSYAKEWHIDPHKIGVLGFSAGGHLSVDISTHSNRRAYQPVDAADKASCRPDFAVVLYPGHLWIDTSKFELNPDIRVTKDVPPTLLIQAEDDPVDSINNTLVYFRALKKANVPVEMHIYAHGGHAFGLRRTEHPITQWPELTEKWLRTIGMVGR